MLSSWLRTKLAKAPWGWRERKARRALSLAAIWAALNDSSSAAAAWA